MIAVVLARGVGRRMQAGELAGGLTASQREAAAAGLKAMMPVGAAEGRPFLDYVLSGLADAGCTEVCLVVAPDHGAMRDYYRHERPSRLHVTFAVQADPTGTAHAVLAAERVVGRRPFLVVNGDNRYPPEAVQALVDIEECGLAAFTRASLVEQSGLSVERVARFAVLDADDDGWLTDIREKPDPRDLAASGPTALISMNLWRFDARIFDACRAVAPSVRGEFELPAAVMLAVSQGTRFRVRVARGAVLDLTSPADIADVSRRVSSREPRL